MTYVITEPCIGTKDQSCVEVCPVDCIYDAGDHFMINPEECIDCGACEPECPVEAIYPEDEVPDDMESYTTKAANYFEWHAPASGLRLSARFAPFGSSLSANPAATRPFRTHSTGAQGRWLPGLPPHSQTTS